MESRSGTKTLLLNNCFKKKAYVDCLLKSNLRRLCSAYCIYKTFHKFFFEIFVMFTENHESFLSKLIKSNINQISLKLGQTDEVGVTSRY